MTGRGRKNRDMYRYTALIDGETGAYGVSFPDLPGCVAMGRTVDGALMAAAEAHR
jgi:predicted RNase H-like HicB family nuclease